MDFKSIQELLRFINKSDLTEVEIQQKDFKLRVARKSGENIVYTQMPSQQMMQPMQQQMGQQLTSLPQAEKKTEDPGEGGNLHTFKSPIIGTFYRSGGPDKESFVKVGDVVQPKQVLCIIEAMKLFNEIECDLSGKIVKILVENAQPVEYDQPLFLIEPA